jgi:poly-beta-1,6-N-acetyl-D-glucosamine synthase
MAAALFWTSVAGLAYALVGYAVAVCLVARRWPRPVIRRAVRPRVTVVVVAYNEADRIAARIENLLALEYPRDLLDIVVASDGSTDQTVARARAYEPAVRVVACPARRGKPAVLNEIVPSARGEVVLLADARQRFAPSALTALVEGFADETVGAVSGELMLVNEDQVEQAAGEGVAIYWNYEKSIRTCESVVDSTVGATGAIYAIRRDLFEPIPADTILDDVLIPMRFVHRGYRVLFEPRARAFDRKVTSAHEEFVRKVRTIAGNLQWFVRERWVWDPRQNRLWIQTVSHKGLRLLLPVLFFGAVAGNALLLDTAFYRWTLAAQIVFAAAAGGGHFVESVRGKARLLIVPHTVYFLAAATVVAWFRFVTGRQAVTWDRAQAPGRPDTVRARRVAP